MSTTILNEHDANQGAQSKGEFLGMTGNSGWYLLGSAGTTIMMVIVLWGVFDVSLLLCVMLGVSLCLLSLAYVFTLKNNKPDHYDTDFFESALVEAGLLELTFGPRTRRLANPFARLGTGAEDPAPVEPLNSRRSSPKGASAAVPRSFQGLMVTEERARRSDAPQKQADQEKEPVVARAAYEKLQGEMADMEERLDEALAGQEED